MVYDYENEEQTDEARTNEEAYEDLPQSYAKMVGQEIGMKTDGTTVFFNTDYLDNKESYESS